MKSMHRHRPFWARKPTIHQGHGKGYERRAAFSLNEPKPFRPGTDWASRQKYSPGAATGFLMHLSVVAQASRYCVAYVPHPWTGCPEKYWTKRGRQFAHAWGKWGCFPSFPGGYGPCRSYRSRIFFWCTNVWLDSWSPV